MPLITVRHKSTIPVEELQEATKAVRLSVRDCLSVSDDPKFCLRTDEIDIRFEADGLHDESYYDVRFIIEANDRPDRRVHGGLSAATILREAEIYMSPRYSCSVWLKLVTGFYDELSIRVVGVIS